MLINTNNDRADGWGLGISEKEREERSTSEA
jgi:hypothetical protein